MCRDKFNKNEKANKHKIVLRDKKESLKIGKMLIVPKLTVKISPILMKITSVSIFLEPENLYKVYLEK